MNCHVSFKEYLIVKCSDQIWDNTLLVSPTLHIWNFMHQISVTHYQYKFNIKITKNVILCLNKVSLCLLSLCVLSFSLFFVLVVFHLCCKHSFFVLFIFIRTDPNNILQASNIFWYVLTPTLTLVLQTALKN